jgi:putative ABC transport system substrate-binding protein
MVVRDTATWLATAVIHLLVAAPLAADAQPTGKVYRIGFILAAAANETGHLMKALNEGLRELGYVEGRNVVFERRFAEGRQHIIE